MSDVCVPSSPPDTWYLELEVPVDLTVQYRYLVVQRFKSAESKDAFGVVRWETTLHPRHFCLAGTPIGEDCKLYCKKLHHANNEQIKAWHVTLHICDYAKVSQRA